MNGDEVSSSVKIGKFTMTHTITFSNLNKIISETAGQKILCSSFT